VPTRNRDIVPRALRSAAAESARAAAGSVLHKTHTPLHLWFWAAYLMSTPTPGLSAVQWGERYPAVVRLWDNAWSEFIPFLDYDLEIRRALSTTNAIESLIARYRRAIKARGHFPSEQAAMKCLYLVTRSLDPTGRGRARWAMRWKPALNAFAITFGDRFPAAESY
jgi:hypothetical protein